MADPILDEIWRVRAELIKRHGGVAGYFEHVRQLDLARRQRRGRQKSARVRRQRVKTT
jgi:hypothetical protein